MSLITRHRPALLGIALAGVLGAAAVAVGSATSAATVTPTVTPAVATVTGPHSHPGRVHAVHTTPVHTTVGHTTAGAPADTADRVEARKGVTGRQAPTPEATHPARTASGLTAATHPHTRVVPLRGAPVGD